MTVSTCRRPRTRGLQKMTQSSVDVSSSTLLRSPRRHCRRSHKGPPRTKEGVSKLRLRRGGHKTESESGAPSFFTVQMFPVGVCGNSRKVPTLGDRKRYDLTTTYSVDTLVLLVRPTSSLRGTTPTGVRTSLKSKRWDG